MYDSEGVRNKGGKHANEWSATGAQFQQPYVFKKLFSGEPITFDDLCETKSVSGIGIFLDMNENLPCVECVEMELEKRKKSAKRLNAEFEGISDEELVDIVKKGHDYKFVGRVGLFVPIKPGHGGGVMFRENDGKYYSVTGTKGYRWLEAEMVRELHKEDDVDISYHEGLVSEAIKSINKFGSFERFIDVSKPYIPPEPVQENDDKEDDDVPWSTLPPVVPCGDGKYNTCLECPNCKDDICKLGYSLNVYNGGD